MGSSYNPRRRPGARRSGGRNNVAIGDKSQSVGQKWEEHLAALHAHLLALGEATILQTHPPFVKTGQTAGGKLIGFFKKKGAPDFMGLLRGGQGICFDAKATTGERVEFKQLKSHQAAVLEAFVQTGGVAGVMQRVTVGGRFLHLWLPWERLGPLYAEWQRKKAALRHGERLKKGEASLSLAQLREIGVEWRGSWLEAVRAAADEDDNSAEEGARSTG